MCFFLFLFGSCFSLSPSLYHSRRSRRRHRRLRFLSALFHAHSLSHTHHVVLVFSVVSPSRTLLAFYGQKMHLSIHILIFSVVRAKMCINCCSLSLLHFMSERKSPLLCVAFAHDSIALLARSPCPPPTLLSSLQSSSCVFRVNIYVQIHSTCVRVFLHQVLTITFTLYVETITVILPLVVFSSILY